MKPRVDFDLILDTVEPGARVLDVGCGDGALLARLEAERNAQGFGLELSQSGVNAAVARGLSVVQGDADRDLAVYPDAGFDYAILTQTIQATRNPKAVLSDLLRIARRAIVSFPNFGHWRVRWSLMSSGRMPVTAALNAPWHATENIHLCTVRDFTALVDEVGAHVEALTPIAGGRARHVWSTPLWVSNWMAEEALFVLSRSTPLDGSP
jgi:methionine biosynthesis protein MetW